MVITANELLTEVGDYLERAEAGETIVVTREGRPVVELRPCGIVERDELKLRELERAGYIRLPKHPYVESDFKPLKISGPSIVDAIIEDREDRC